MPPAVVIWSGAGGVGHDVSFMYRPILDTIMTGLARPPNNALRTIGNIRTVAGTDHKELLKVCSETG